MHFNTGYCALKLVFVTFLRTVHSKALNDAILVVTVPLRNMKCRACYERGTIQLKEGREGVKWELGLACFCIGKMGFRSLGLGFESEKKAKIGMGLVFCSHISGIWTLVSGIWKNNGGWEMGLVIPLHDPLKTISAKQTRPCHL